MPPKLVIVCLGNEAFVVGPFDTDKDVQDELDMHVIGDDFCPNNIMRDDHHILELNAGFFS